MFVTRLEVVRREPYAGGISFGDTGPYERIDGILHYAVDPDHPANSSITDLHLAQRNAQGLVEFSGDVVLLMPQDPQRGSRRALLEDPNRGRTGFHRNFNRSRAGDASAVSSDGSVEIDPGDGFLFRHGFSVASVGWQWDVRRGSGLLGFNAPVATENGQPLRGQAIVEIFTSAWQRSRLLANREHHPIVSADDDDPDAVLTVRDWEDGPDTLIPRDQWRFAHESDAGEVVPSTEHIFLEDGFQPGKIYRVVYTTEGAPVVGSGLLALRDAASFLKHGGDIDALGGLVDRVYGWGRSQTGRLWRHFLWLGLNQDESDQQAFDGLIPLVAGGRRGEFNHRFAQPSTQTNPNFGHLFPFADEEFVDPFTGLSDGLLKRQRERGGAPRVMYIDTSAEYWRGDGSLSHTDPGGERDAPEVPETRRYLFSSTQHMIGVVPLIDGTTMDGVSGQHPFNAIDYTPLLRCALLNLDRWCSSGVEPPPSKFPRLSDGSAARRAEVLEQFERIPGIVRPNPDRLPILRRVELGPRASEGVGEYPVTEHETYPAYVSAVDEDGNEIGGLRPPDIAVPVATYTGWNPRHPDIGAPEQILNMHGITHFFARTRAEREALGDPRPSIEERYADREDYLRKVRAYAEQLVEDGYLLSEDIDEVLADSGKRYDTAIASTRPEPHGT